MAKKPQVPPAPEMTALPITNGDSPLVIDLPDGQKLVVGNLAAGSVIEVATWRGTGRPDSRTSRLMLGMSSAAQQPAQAAQSEEKKSAPSLISKVTGVVKALVLKVSSLAKAKKKSPSEKKESAPLIEKVAPAAKSSNSAEVDDWLNSILEKSAKKSAAQKSVDVPEEKPSAKKAVAKATPKKKPAGRTR